MLADYMITELREQILTVILIPAPEQKHEGHMIRCAVMRNPEWFRGEGISRKECFISLNRIRFGLPLSSNTDDKMYDIVKRLIDRYKSQGY